ncbi:MAG TPA: LysE family translocator [Thiotrichales bacterium]|nr:LysE family translocator [Thiotrichales bacterium]
MQTTITLGSAAALFVAMFSLAIIPDASAVAVVSRSLAAGIRHGVIVVIGIVACDIVFIALAVSGLSLLATSLGAVFTVVKVLAGLYLLWSGIALWRTPPDGAGWIGSDNTGSDDTGSDDTGSDDTGSDDTGSDDTGPGRSGTGNEGQTKPEKAAEAAAGRLSWWPDFLCGFFITLGDAKAILFYLSFLPAFVELSQATLLDAIVIMLVAALAIAVTKLGYAVMASHSRQLLRQPAQRKIINRVAGLVLMVTGVYLLFFTVN